MDVVTKYSPVYNIVRLRTLAQLTRRQGITPSMLHLRIVVSRISSVMVSFIVKSADSQ
jgi:hypothetical protein